MKMRVTKMTLDEKILAVRVFGYATAIVIGLLAAILFNRNGG